jgi:hypothetical protein
MLFALNCSGAREEPKSADDEAAELVPEGADASRCNFRNRKDRASLVFKSYGAEHPNIRRVFAVSQRQRDDRVLRCREVDTNLDGTKDLFRTYNKKGDPVTEEADSDYDGKIDTWLRFAAGKIAEARFDRSRDGKPDELRTYDGGTLVRTRKDTDHDGKIDTWEVYEDGRMTRVGLDLNADGRVDEWHRDAEYEREKEAAELAKERKAGLAPPAQASKVGQAAADSVGSQRKSGDPQSSATEPERKPQSAQADPNKAPPRDASAKPTPSAKPAASGSSEAAKGL